MTVSDESDADRPKSHLHHVLRWDRTAPSNALAATAAALGLAGPALVGVWQGHPGAGLLAGFFALAVGGAGVSKGASVGIVETLILPTLGAGIAAALIAGHGVVSDMLVVAIAGLAALLGGLGRIEAVAALRFVPFFVIATGMSDRFAGGAGALLLLMGAGAAWVLAVNAAFSLIARMWRGAEAAPQAAMPQPRSVAPWWRRLGRRANWLYALRLSAGFAVGTALIWAWPDHHFSWVLLTVAILTERTIERLPVRITQRAIGTLIGVALASLLLLGRPPDLVLILAVAGLAGIRVVLRARSYLAYSIVMTPLVLLMMEAGQTSDAGALEDRLIATGIGAALVLAANAIGARLDRV
jgi:hypothetical protein